MGRGISFALCLSLVLAGSAEARVTRTHKPWFGKSAPAVPAPEPIFVDEVPVPKQSTRVPVKGERIAQRAVAYKGTRYRFGGTSKYGLDCSGLINRVWMDLQMNKIPRASAALYQKGDAVKLAELQPGDLVFFKNTYKRGVSHVGVYTGKNKFVHASPRRGVTITKLSDPYYQLHYAGARRLY